MSHVLVVGSGASGVHFALTALQRGHQVTMLDVGTPRPEPVLPQASFAELKARLADPAAYFLGERGEGVVYPVPEGAFYGHPPSKDYVFSIPEGYAVDTRVMEPLFSFARGGFAEAWTAGAYAFDRADVADFPFPYEELEACYDRVARRIGIGGQPDDLERFIPLRHAVLPPLPLDPHSQWLWDRYQARRDRLHARGFFLGRSRVATLSRPLGDRPACRELGRCLWGCPTESIYSPVATLRECLAAPGFRYVPGLLVRHFECAENGSIRRVVARRLADGELVQFEAERVALAAGALASSKIVLDSLYRRSGRVAVLRGVMDNRQVHVPFLSPRMIGRPVRTDSYQFHHLAIGIPGASAAEYVHGQITTLKAAAIHPIVASLPLDFKSGLAWFRAMRAGLGVVNLNLADHRRPGCTLSIAPDAASGETALQIRYQDDPAEPAQIRAAIRRLKRALRVLGCFVPPGLIRVRAKGASVHYAGTLPMLAAAEELSCDGNGRSRDFPNLLIVDGAGFPSLPSKNLTFTLMANATRIAERL